MNNKYYFKIEMIIIKNNNITNICIEYVKNIWIIFCLFEN